MTKNYTIEKNRKWKIGDVTIEKIFEFEMVQPWETGFKWVVPKARVVPEEIDWLIPTFANEKYDMSFAIQSFLIKSQGKNILVETGMNAPTPDFDENLKRAGVAPEDIDYVMFTHLHYDHVGRNAKMSTFGNLAPTFPNARYLFSSESYNYLKEIHDNPEKRTGIPEIDHIWPFRLHMLSMVEQGKVDFIDDTFTLHDVISLVPTPGHQPGQVGLFIRSQGDSAFIGGDFCQHPLQMTQIDASTGWDFDPEASVKTREKIFGELVDTDTLVLVMHWMKGGFVVRAPNGCYKLLTE